MLLAYSLGRRIVEDKNLLHQCLELVNEYTLGSPHLGAFLLSVLFGYHMPEQEIIEVHDYVQVKSLIRIIDQVIYQGRIRPLTTRCIASLELLARSSGRSIIHPGSDDDVRQYVGSYFIPQTTA
jgi:hypothetical protein